MGRWFPINNRFVRTYRCIMRVERDMQKAFGNVANIEKQLDTTSTCIEGIDKRLIHLAYAKAEVDTRMRALENRVGDLHRAMDGLAMQLGQLTLLVQQQLQTTEADTRRP